MNERDSSIDILRGLAIFTMIPANMAAHGLAEPHSFGFRLYGSVAAPLFVFLAGMMVVYTLNKKSYTLSYYIKRAGLTCLIAVLIDTLIWGTLPFLTFDVLYVIAFAMPVIYFFYRLPTWAQVLIVCAIFALTPILQQTMGYNPTPEESALIELKRWNDLFNTRAWPQFLIDGWFPMFPWMGVSLTGALIGKLMVNKTKADFHKWALIVGSTLLSAGILSWIVAKPELITRDGYSELFYPPTLYYMSTFLGMALMLLPIASKIQGSAIIRLLTVYGRSSMLVYILHTVFNVYLFTRVPTTTFWPFMGLYLIHALVLWIICFGVQKWMTNKKPPFVVGFVLGK